MSDRYKGLIVTLKEPIKDEDAKALISAIEQLRHVIDVQPVIETGTDHMVAQRVRYELSQQLFRVLWPNTEAKP